MNATDGPDKPDKAGKPGKPDKPEWAATRGKAALSPPAKTCRPGNRRVGQHPRRRARPQAGRDGRFTLNWLPWPTPALAAVSVPPCSWTRRCASVRPTPRP